MKDATAAVGTSLEVLAPYFPYKVQVQVLPDGWDPCTVVALDNLECRVVTRWFDELYNPESFNGRTSYEQVSYMDCLPVLRPFSALCDPLQDGKVPAVAALYEALGYPSAFSQDGKKRVTARYEPLVKGFGNFVRIEAFPGNQGGWIRLDNDSHAWTFEAFDDYSTGIGKAVELENALAAYDYLRSQHFALPVNGRPLIEGVDFIAKTPAGPLSIQEGKSV